MKSRSFINDAFRKAFRESRKSEEQIAVLTGVTARAVHKWITDESTPSGETVLLLRRVLPGFSTAIDPLVERRAQELLA